MVGDNGSYSLGHQGKNREQEMEIENYEDLVADLTWQRQERAAVEPRVPCWSDERRMVPQISESV